MCVCFICLSAWICSPGLCPGGRERRLLICWGLFLFWRWVFLCGICHPPPPSAVEMGARGMEGLGLSAQPASRRGGISPSPWSNLLPLLSTMLAAICAVCSWFALAFHFTRFWGPLAFLVIPMELIYVHQGTEHDFFCRVLIFCFLSYVISGVFQQLEAVVLGLAVCCDVVRPAAKKQIHPTWKGHQQKDPSVEVWGSERVGS